MSTSNFQMPSTPEEAQKEFERLFEELMDLLQMTLEGLENQPDQIPSNFVEKVNQLEREVISFQNLGAELKAELEKSEKSSRPLTLKEQAIIERSKILVKETQEKQMQLPSPSQAPNQDIGDQKQLRKHLKRLGRKKV